MYAIVTGASSGIGYEFAKELAAQGYDLILVARRKDRLDALAASLNVNCIVIPCDLSKEENVYNLVDQIKNYDIKLCINNAGFGDCGYFLDTDIKKELDMIDVNVRSMYLLMKLMLKTMNDGYILNVSSVAGLLPAGPYMSNYYATKAYVTSLTIGVSCELKQNKSKLRVGCLCPGPVNTEFNDVANVRLALKGISAKKCVKYALKKIKRKKTIIVPSFIIRMSAVFSKLLPRKMIASVTSSQQKKKM